MESEALRQYGQQVIATEIDALNRLSNNLSDSLSDALKLIINCKGRIVITGMGKSGLVGKKISATFSSTGTPSFFLHPAEALHGDLGMMKKDDVVISISNSGNSDEILRLIPYFKTQGIKHITMTGKSESILAKNADVVLDISIDKEACPLQLAPMASTTATLVMGDVLAACLMESRGFKPENFAVFHPAGALGRKLLCTVADEMRTERLPYTQENVSIKDLIFQISKGQLGLAIVLDKEEYLLGIVTDGDIRRALEKFDESQFFKLKVSDVMTKNPITVLPTIKINDVEELLRLKKIKAVLVAENRKVKGVFEYNGVL